MSHTSTYSSSTFFNCFSDHVRSLLLFFHKICFFPVFRNDIHSSLLYSSSTKFIFISTFYPPSPFLDSFISFYWCIRLSVLCSSFQCLHEICKSFVLILRYVYALSSDLYKMDVSHFFPFLFQFLIIPVITMDDFRLQILFWINLVYHIFCSFPIMSKNL